MIAATLISTPRRLNHAFLFAALLVAAYPLWHADAPAPVNAVADTAVEHVVVVPPMPNTREAGESTPAVDDKRIGACRG